MAGKRKTLSPMAAAIASMAFMGFASAPVLGQSAGNQGNTNAQSTASQSQQGMQSRDRQSSRSGSASRQVRMADMRASELMGRDVRNARGEELGELTDMVVDLENNRIHYAILERGGILGIGDKAVPVPVSRFQTGRGDELVLNISERQLENAPGLERDVEWNDPSTWDNVGQYYHLTLGMPGDGTQGARRFHWASDLIGMDVIDPTGDEVGEIEDIVVNLANGQIHYAVLEFDRAWNPNDKLVVLPMKWLQATGGDLTVSLTREQLATAPSFEPRRWPDLSDRRFRDRVAAFGEPGTTGMDRSAAAGMPTVIVLIDEPQFTQLDADRDGRLSRQEVRQFNQLTQNWDAVDRNGDGYLTPEELNNSMGRSGSTSGSGGQGTSRGQSGASGSRSQQDSPAGSRQSPYQR